MRISNGAGVFAELYAIVYYCLGRMLQYVVVTELYRLDDEVTVLQTDHGSWDFIVD